MHTQLEEICTQDLALASTAQHRIPALVTPRIHHFLLILLVAIGTDTAALTSTLR